MALQRFFVSAPSLGINGAAPPGMIPDRACVRAQNMRFRNGEAFKRTGAVALDGITGTPCLLAEFLRESGSSEALLAAEDALYKWDGAAWSSLAMGLNGAASGRHSAAVLGDKWFYTNGVDVVKQYNGTAVASLGGGGDYQSSGSTHLAKGLLAYQDRLLLLATTEDGADYPMRVRWSELGKVDEWDESEGGGYRDLTDDPSGVYGGAMMGNVAYIYCGRSIWAATYLGLPVAYAFDRVVAGIGCRAPRTIQDAEGYHIFLGPDDVYAFDGHGLKGIGAPIRDALFAELPVAEQGRAFAALNRDEKLYYLYVPSSGTTISKVYIYDYQEGTWTTDSVNGATCAAVLEMGTSLTIDGLDALAATIDALPGPTIDSLGGYSGKRHRLVGLSDGSVLSYQQSLANDGAAATQGVMDTKDFALSERYLADRKRLLDIEVEAKGGKAGDTLDVLYSTDAGDTWTLAKRLTLGREYERHRVNVDAVGRLFRLRFLNSASGERFAVRWYGMGFVPRSKR